MVNHKETLELLLNKDSSNKDSNLKGLSSKDILRLKQLEGLSSMDILRLMQLEGCREQFQQERQHLEEVMQHLSKTLNLGHSLTKRSKRVALTQQVASTQQEDLTRRVDLTQLQELLPMEFSQEDIAQLLDKRQAELAMHQLQKQMLKLLRAEPPKEPRKLRRTSRKRSAQRSKDSNKAKPN